MQRKVYLFCGTSVDFRTVEAVAQKNWHVLNPIKRGDIPKILEKEKNSGIICIIDGLFFSHESVSLSEIREAIRFGWKVMGCSSMGALRAVEARPLGMEGFGRVFRWLSLFRVEDDDEVAQAIDPENWRPISLAMVDIRGVISELIHSHFLSNRRGAEIVQEFKSLFFPLRTADLLSQRVGIEVAKYSSKQPKRKDALEMLNHLRGQI